MVELLIELLSEEIPARMQARAATDFATQLSDRLKIAALEPLSVRSFVTPRRIAVVANGLPLRQPDREEERRGPRIGAPDKATQGFLRANGLLSLDECEVREVKGAEFYFIIRQIEGQSAESTIPAIIVEAISAIPWPKSMRWADTERRYVRPLKRVSVVLNGKPLNGEIDFGGVSGRKPFTAMTVGHRFMSGDSPVPLTNFESYKSGLKQAFVLLDPTERKAKIEAGLQAIAEANGLTVKHDPGLLDEVTGLVEWPVVLSGHIDDAFMSVPAEALTTSMRTHQKYFALETCEGTLAPFFAVVANIQSKDDGKRIIAGNERVLRARLADARFFWDQDRKIPLSNHLAALEKVVFHAKLGTLANRVRRMRSLSRTMAEAISGAAPEKADKAAMLSKADLVSGMVGEFPELQGVMGRYYALEEGVDSEIADAIRDHYAPQGPQDACPMQPVSIAVALAEKLDTLAGFFAIDEKPTGSRDPYALRRAALGIIRLVLENKLALPLRPAFMAAYAGYTGLTDAANADTTAKALLQFIGDRLKVHLRGRNMPHHHISAVFALGNEDDLVRIVGRVEALGTFLASEDGVNLLTAYRRAANIAAIESKKDGHSFDEAPEASLFEQDEERDLAIALAEIRPTAASAISSGSFGDAIATLARLRQPVDAFFEEVTVNAENKAVRANRLRLLSLIGATMRELADFDPSEG